MAYEYTRSLTPESLAPYSKKLDLCGLQCCPYQLSPQEWLDDPSSWPDVTHGDIWEYLVNTPGVYTREAMRNFKSLQGHQFFTAGWVRTVLHLLTPNATLVLKADVTPSYRVNEEPHHPWLCLKPDGTVLTAHCTRAAGLGESCSHVAALLFKIEAACRAGVNKVACTSAPCTWNVYTDSFEGRDLAHVDPYTDESKAHVKQPFKAPILPPTPDRIEELSQLIALANPRAVFLSTLTD